jgi:hypothetical protein
MWQEDEEGSRSQIFNRDNTPKERYRKKGEKGSLRGAKINPSVFRDGQILEARVRSLPAPPSAVILKAEAEMALPFLYRLQSVIVVVQDHHGIRISR